MDLEKIKKYIRSMGTYFGALVITMLLLAAINPFLAMFMTPEDYSVFGYYNSFTNLLTPVITFYMLNYYNKRYFEVSEEERLRLKAVLFKALIYFSLIVSVVCLAGLVGYIHFFEKDFTFPIFPHVAIAVFTIPLAGIYKLEQNDCRMSRNAKGFFKITVAQAIILSATNLVFVVAIKWGSFGKLLGPFAANFIVFIWLLIRHRDLFRINSTFSEFWAVVKFCLPLAAGAMLGYFFNGFDRTYLERLGDVESYGNYTVAYQFAGYLSVFSGAVISTFQPDIYEAVARRDTRGFFLTCFAQIGIIALIVIAFILLCHPLIWLLTAGNYMGAVPYARIIAISSVASTTYYVINNYTIAKGYPRIYLYTTLISSALVIFAMPRMVGAFGFNGGAWMTSLSFVILALINLIFLGFLSVNG
ncbi:MAG: oligosaccharide flippase family protein, partial [Bacteroidales bacterium]|nr:oligosaccharide flippase family protein [Bacteroidales bacterium]